LQVGVMAAGPEGSTLRVEWPAGAPLATMRDGLRALHDGPRALHEPARLVLRQHWQLPAPPPAAADLTRLVYEIGASCDCSRLQHQSVELPSPDCSRRTSALLKGLGFNHVDIRLDGEPPGSTLQAAELAREAGFASLAIVVPASAVGAATAVAPMLAATAPLVDCVRVRAQPAGAADHPLWRLAEAPGRRLRHSAGYAALATALAGATLQAAGLGYFTRNGRPPPGAARDHWQCTGNHDEIGSRTLRRRHDHFACDDHQLAIDAHTRALATAVACIIDEGRLPPAGAWPDRRGALCARLRGLGAATATADGGSQLTAAALPFAGDLCTALLRADRRRLRRRG
jgi:hypothetical protein